MYQHKITQFMKKPRTNILFHILDTFAVDPAFARHAKMLHTLYIRGRQHMISAITATQQFNAFHPIIRFSATELFMFRLRHTQDLDTFIHEVSAVVDKQTLM